MSSLSCSDGTLALSGNFEKFPIWAAPSCYCGLGDTATNAQKDACHAICGGLATCDSASNVCTFQLGMGYSNLDGKDLRFTAMQSLVDECSVTLLSDGNAVKITCDTSDSYEKALQSQSFQYVIDPSL